MDPRLVVERKLRALAIRQKVEALATQLWCDFLGVEYDTLSHSQIALRLRLLASRADACDKRKAWALAIALANAYSETSNLIHGRAAAARVRAGQFDEWEALLLEAERIESAPETTG